MHSGKLGRQSISAVLALLYWTAFHAVMLILVAQECRVRFEMCPLFLHGPDSWYALAGIPVAFLLETQVCFLGFWGLWRSKWAKQIPPAALGLLKFVWLASLFTYFFLLSLSGFFYVHRGTFLTASQTQLANFLLDPATLYTCTATSDLISLGVSAIAAILLVSLWLIVMRGLNSRIKVRFLMGISALPLTLTAALVVTTRFDMTEGRLTKVQEVASYFASPSLSLLWSKVFFGSRPTTYSVKKLALLPRDTESREQRGSDPSSHPNIILVVVEALRADVLNDPRKRDIMPHAQKLASGGLSFSRAYATAPETGASFFTLVTGLYPLLDEVRFTENTPFFPFTRIFDELTRGGYKTGYFTFEWLSSRRISETPSLQQHRDPQLDGPDEMRKFLPPDFLRLNPPEQMFVPAGDTYNVEALLRWIRESEGEKPFFAILYIFSPHFPYLLPNGAETPFQPSTLPGNPSFLSYPKKWKDIIWNRYSNSLRFADALIARITDELTSQNAFGNTQLILTGDHGELFHEHDQVTHSGFLHEEAIRVPLVFAHAIPEACPGRLHYPVSLLDLPPTILDLAGLPPNPAFQGTSLISKENCRESSEHRETPRAVFASVQVHTNEDAVIVWPWKFVKNFSGYGERLFNLEEDSQENVNLVSTKPVEANYLRDLLHEFRSNQLSYYGNQGYTSSYYPPAPDDAASGVSASVSSLGSSNGLK